MDAKQIDAFAQTIADARRTRKPMDVAGAIAGMTEADAYKVQFAVHDKICAGGADRVAGWKVALTLPHSTAPHGAVTPAEPTPREPSPAEPSARQA